MMKKAFILLMAVVVATTATAVNRLYLPDFTICPGETMIVALLLDNDEQFTAFQTDLILPEGLSVVQEDDEFLFDLTGRNASDHAIISKLRDDGAIRIVSFSIGVKPYSGNSGPLVIIHLTASDDFSGPAAISLKNSILATLNGEACFVAGESCEVGYLEKQIVGDINGDGLVDISDATGFINYLLTGYTSSSFHIENADLNADGKIDISDVTMLINWLLGGV